VFEEMGEAGAAGALVERTNVIPEVNGDKGEVMVFVHEDEEAIGHDELFVLEFGDLEGLGRWKGVCGVDDGCSGKTEQQRGGGYAFGCEPGCEQRFFHHFSIGSWARSWKSACVLE
jgi:hypothetical protein